MGAHRGAQVRQPVGHHYIGPMEGFQVVSRGPAVVAAAGTVARGRREEQRAQADGGALLARGRTTVTNVPDILDVHVMARLLEELGCTVAVAHPEAEAGAGSRDRACG